MLLPMPEPTVDWASALPAAPLRPFVDRYVGYRLAGFAPGTHRGLPSRHMTLIVSIGEAIDVVEQTDPRQGPQRYACVLGGLQAAPASIAVPERQEGVVIELTPLGSRALLGPPAAALRDLAVEMSEVVGPVGAELWERLQGRAPWAARFGVCDEVLARMLTGRTVDETLGGAWGMLVASRGTVPVGRLAAACGWSRQHLGRRFRDELGMGPKLAARIVRFERARRLLLDARRRRPLAELALDCGYFDQAHLDRDFRRLAGCPPTTLVAEEVPFFQDEAGEAGAECAT
jgi:AraC-like DNA-binding protein